MSDDWLAEAAAYFAAAADDLEETSRFERVEVGD